MHGSESASLGLERVALKNRVAAAYVNGVGRGKPVAGRGAKALRCDGAVARQRRGVVRAQLNVLVGIEKCAS